MKGGIDPGGLNILLIIHVQQKKLYKAGYIERKDST